MGNGIEERRWRLFTASVRPSLSEASVDDIHMRSTSFVPLGIQEVSCGWVRLEAGGGAVAKILPVVGSKKLSDLAIAA